jgi:hypothetical protein
MRRHISIGLSIVLGGMPLFGRAGAQTLACPGPSASATAFRSYVQRLMSFPTTASTRDYLGTQMMDTSAVVLVTSDSVCTGVTRAFDSASASGPRTYAFIVVKFGDLYAACNPQTLGKGESGDFVFIFNKNFVFQVAIAR